MLIRAGTLLVAMMLVAAPSDAAQGDLPLDEAARACPTYLDGAPDYDRWWCGFDPAEVVAVEDGKQRLTAFKTHRYPSVATMPSESAVDLDWICIEGECGGLLDPTFIIGRELSHVWTPAEDDPGLIMTEERWRRAVRGRNSWLLWSGGNHAFWDHLARHGYGLSDFVKLLDNRTVARADRFRKLGVINEPGMEAPEHPNRFGLRFDRPIGWEGEWPPEPGTSLPDGAPDPLVYGYSSGVMGMRLFPNPDFFYGEGAEAARREWDPEQFMTDLNYSKDPDLIRPYRVGVACGFCHVSFNPLSPPQNVAEPEWRNLASAFGNQHLKFGRVAAYDFTESNFLWHLVNSARPGTLDTSLVATDGINNPNVVNGVFALAPRVANSYRFEETVNDATARQPVLDVSVLGLGLPELPAGTKRKTMRVLGGGEDSVGGRLALTRVYLNIGLFYEYWKEQTNFLIGVHEERPVDLDVLSSNSVYWNISLARTQDMAEYLAYVSGQMPLAEAEGGEPFVSTDPAAVERGRAHFVTHCMVCHSTRQPERFWSAPEDWRRWVRDPQYLAEAAEIARTEGFVPGNFFGTDIRYPVTDISVNMARFLNDNSMEGAVWQEFSSTEYKAQPVLEVAQPVQYPYREDETWDYRFRSGTGPGRVRPLPLNNMWATAPFLHTNAVGAFPEGHDPSAIPREEGGDVSVAGRMAVFEDSAAKLLHLKPRDGYSSVARTTVDSQLEVPRVVAIDFLRQQIHPIAPAIVAGLLALLALLGVAAIAWGLRRLARKSVWRFLGAFGVVGGLFLVVGSTQLAFAPIYRIGHIPAGTPVGLLVNLNGPAWLAKNGEGRLFDVAWDLGLAWLYALPSLDHERVPGLVENLLALNKSPDFVLDRGHDFGGKDIVDVEGSLVMPALTVEERRDLVEFLKTL